MSALRFCLLAAFLFCISAFESHSSQVDPSKFVVSGPGLFPHQIVLPARYFFIKTAGSDGTRYNRTS